MWDIYKKVGIVSMLSLLWCSGIIAQVPDTTWTRTYGEVDDDGGFSVQQTADNGFIIAGYTDIPGGGGYDFYLIKTNVSGDTLWTKTYGGPNSDYARSVQETTDGGYIIVGYSSSFGSGLRDVYMVKTDSLGNVLWTKAYGGSDYDVGFSVKQTDDNGYIVVGYTSSFGAGSADVWLLKTDSLGDTLWTRTYGRQYYDTGWSVQATSDGGYIVAGYYGVYDGSYLWVFKTDADGNALWTKIYGNGNAEHGTSVEEIFDSCYIVTGYIWNSGTGSTDVWLLKIDAFGDTIWTNVYGGANTDCGFSVLHTADSGFVVVGETWSFGNGYKDIYVIRTNANGDTLWTRVYGGVAYDNAFSIDQTIDGGYIVAGYTESFGAGGNDVWLLKLGPDTLDIEDHNTNNLCGPFVEIFPNPFSNSVYIKCRTNSECKTMLHIYNSIGQLIRCFPVNKHTCSPIRYIIWDGHDSSGNTIPSGVYFLEFKTGDYRETRKLILYK